MLSLFKILSTVIFLFSLTFPCYSQSKRKDVIRRGKVTFCSDQTPRHLRYVNNVYLSKKPHMDAKVEALYEGRTVFRGTATQNYQRRIDLEGDWLVSPKILGRICSQQLFVDLVILSVYPKAKGKSKEKNKKKEKSFNPFALRNAIGGPLLSIYGHLGTPTSVSSHHGFEFEINPWGHYPINLHAGQYLNSTEMAAKQGDQFISTVGLGTGILLGDKFSKVILSGNINQYTLTTSELNKSYYAFLPTAGFRLQMLAETYFEMDISTHIPFGDDLRVDMAETQTGIYSIDQIDPTHGIEVRIGLGVGF
ncbi:MAG: hypothetical protein AB8C84_13325 [Oligoflexales bacterium]